MGGGGGGLDGEVGGWRGVWGGGGANTEAMCSLP